MRIILLTIAAFASTSIAVSVGEWTGRVEVDAMTDKQTIVMETYNSADLVGAFFLGTDIPVFAVLFIDDVNVPVFAVHYSQFIGTSGRTSTCMVRVDQNAAVEYPVVIANDTKTILIGIGSADETREFFASLLRGNQVMVRFQPFGGDLATSTFSLSGLTGVSRSMGIDVDSFLNFAGCDEGGFEYNGLYWQVGPDEDITWDQAKEWADGLGGNWRMPTRAELQGLWDAGISADNWGPFENTGQWVWSGELYEHDSSSAGGFIFSTGGEYWCNRSRSVDLRACAVRPL